MRKFTCRGAKPLKSEEMTTSNHTLEEVDKQFDVTRERIHQIEARASRQFKHP